MERLEAVSGGAMLTPLEGSVHYFSHGFYNADRTPMSMGAYAEVRDGTLRLWDVMIGKQVDATGRVEITPDTGNRLGGGLATIRDDVLQFASEQGLNRVEMKYQRVAAGSTATPGRITELAFDANTREVLEHRTSLPSTGTPSSGPGVISRIGDVTGIRSAFGTPEGRGGFATAATLMAIDDSRAWRDANLSPAVNAPLNGVSDAVKLATNGPVPVFPAGTLAYHASQFALTPIVGETAAKYLSLVPATGAELKATALSGGVYGLYNLGAAATNVLANGREDPAMRAARLDEAQQYKYWENQAYEWAAARGDQNFTLGDAHRTASDMVRVMNEPPGAGLSVFTPDGRSFGRIDASYADAMSSLVASGRYGSDYLGNFTPGEVVALHQSELRQQATRDDLVSRLNGNYGTFGEEPLLRPDANTAGATVFSPDGSSVSVANPDYVAAMQGLTSTGRYGEDYLGNFTPQQVVGMYQGEQLAQFQRDDLAARMTGNQGAFGEEPLLTPDANTTSATAYLPSGESISIVDPEYGAATQALVNTGQYGNDYLGNMTRDEVVQLAQNEAPNVERQSSPEQVDVRRENNIEPAFENNANYEQPSRAPDAPNYDLPEPNYDGGSFDE